MDILFIYLRYITMLNIPNSRYKTKKFESWKECNDTFSMGIYFLLYIYLALSKAGIGSIWDIGRYSGLFRIDEINLIPFDSVGILTYILNIIMFMPLGFLLPLIWKILEILSMFH